MKARLPLALPFFVVLSVVHTWPLATAPATLSRNDNGDAQLNEWIVSWIAHQLPRAPLLLYDANIFHPEPRTLAFSEPLLVPALLGAPLRWSGASPVLTYNLLLLAGFCMTGLAGYAVAKRLTGDALAGLLCGSLLAFNAQSLTRLPHLQAHYAFLLPVAILLTERLIADSQPRRRDAVGLGLCVALLALTSGYWAALVVVAIGASLIACAPEVTSRLRRVATAFAVAAVVAALVAAPPLLPYWSAHKEQGLTRTLEEAASFASAPTSYLSTPGRVHFALWSHRFFGPRGGSYFPGFVALALALYGARADSAWRTPRVRSLLAIAAAGFVLSLGPATPLYGALHAMFPPMKGLRDPSRFGYLVLLPVALLAALGLAALTRRLAQRRALAAGASLVMLANAEAFAGPMSYVRFEGFSPVYARLAETSGPVVLAEFPFYPAAEIYRNAEYVLASTLHWKPLVNGYSGFTPPSFVARAEKLRGFPDEASFAELRALGVTHVIVHFARYREPRRVAMSDALAARADVDVVADGPDGERLYRLREIP